MAGAWLKDVVRKWQVGAHDQRVDYPAEDSTPREALTPPPGAAGPGSPADFSETCVYHMAGREHAIPAPQPFTNAEGGSQLFCMPCVLVSMHDFSGSSFPGNSTSRDFI